MDQEYIAQTTLDQMVGTDQNQLLKALIPYLPARQQQFLSLYAKASEFSNTVVLFGKAQPPVQMQAASVQAQPLDVLNDIRRYCFGNSRKTIDQMINMMAVIEMIKVVNSSSCEGQCDNHGEDRCETGMQEIVK